MSPAVALATTPREKVRLVQLGTLARSALVDDDDQTLCVNIHDAHLQEVIGVLKAELHERHFGTRLAKLHTSCLVSSAARFRQADVS